MEYMRVSQRGLRKLEVDIVGSIKELRISIVSIFLASLFYATPVLDAFTGYLVNSGVFNEAFIGSPSQLIRALIFLMSFFFLNRNDLKIILLPLVYLVFVELISFVVHRSIPGFVTSMVFTYKLLYSLNIFLALKRLLHRSLRWTRFENYMVNSAFLYALGILVPFAMHMGFPTYGEGTFGTKGFYASGNGLGMFLGIAAVFIFYRRLPFVSWLNFMKYLTILVGLVMVGTKASMIFLILTLCLYFAALPFSVKLLSVAIVAMLLFKFSAALIATFSTVYDVIIFRFQNSPNIWSFIFSGRDAYVRDAFDEFQAKGVYFYRILIGSGSFLSFRTPSASIPQFDTLETDLFDIFFMYGIIGSVAYLLVLLSGIFRALKRRLYIIFFFLIAVSFHSIMAGHVFFNGMSIMGVILLFLAIDEFKSLPYDKSIND